MEENTSLQRKLESAQTQQLLFMSQMMSSSANPAAAQSANPAQQSNSLGYGVQAQGATANMTPGLQSLYQNILS